jgi:ligand-binding sensor domain-containing protein
MDEHIGRRLGSYTIVEQIGQGGMATVFKAYQPSMDRYVAIKILPSHFTEDATFVARFTQEARTLARLEHPHILPVHDYGEQEGSTYLVMRYVGAGTLKDVIIQHGPLELPEVNRFMGQIGRALGYAHTQGIIHRDIKPSNVLIDESGNAFLTDFGIAKLVAGTAQFTATGTVVGTPAYMSPEQCMGKELDHRSDIYALGIVLYEMVTGGVPFEAETPLAVLMQHVNAPLPPPRRIKLDLPESVERVILKTLAKSPDDRFQTAEEMVETLDRAVAGLPTEIALPFQPVGGPTAVVDQVTDEQLTPPPPPELRVEAPVAEAPVAAPPRTRRRIPWLPIAVGAAILAVALVVGLLVVPNLGGDGEEMAPVVAEPPPAGWTNYTNADFVNALARQDDVLWAGGPGGLVRWDLIDRTFVKLGVADGLASNQVYDLLVDYDGNLWVATEAGLNRFDGETWLTFDEADGLDTNWVYSLFLDEESGDVWAGTAYGERGLNTYDGTAWGPPPIPPLPLDFPRPRAFASDEDYGLFVGLDERGLAHFDGGEWEVLTSEDGLPGDQVFDLLLIDVYPDDGSEYRALLASFGREVVEFNLDTGEWETMSQMPGTEIYCLHEDEESRLWFAGEGGATRFDPDTGDWQRFESGPDTIPSWAVTDIVEDEDGLWLATHDGGTVFYDGASWETWSTGDQLGGNQVTSIRQDKGGALWFVHPGDGLSRYDSSTDAWQTFGEADGAFNWPSVPGVDSEGNLWIGEYAQLKRYDGQRWELFEPPELTDETIFKVAFGPDDVMWLSTYNGLIRHDLATDDWIAFTPADHPALEDPSAFYVTADGTVWVGNDYGLATYDGSGWRESDAPGDAPPTGGGEADLHGIAQAPDGSLWVLAIGDLYHLDEAGWSRFSWPDAWIKRMAVSPDSTVWVGAEDLGHFDPSTGAWQTFTTADGLVHQDVEAIYVTAEGDVWIGTEAGLSRYVPPE